MGLVVDSNTLELFTEPSSSIKCSYAEKNIRKEPEVLNSKLNH